MQFKDPSLVSMAFLAATCLAFPTAAQGSLSWQDCPAALAPPIPGIRCAYLDVPMDWDSPHNSGTVKLGMVKLPAQKPNDRIGPLFYNPGGPAALASQELAGIKGSDAIHQEIFDRFDIIGVDLRGSGLSDPIKCDPNLFDSILLTPFYPNSSEVEALYETNQAFRQSCLDMTGSPLFDYMDTKAIARDHEAVRIALGGEPMTYLGLSYGTQLGSQYAELFPNNIRAMILDGIVSKSEPEASAFMEGASSVEATFKYFCDWCAKQNSTTCPLANKSQTVEEIWTGLLERTAKSPISVPACEGTGLCASNLVSAHAILSFTQANLYHPDPQFPILASALYNASFHNNATMMAVPKSSVPNAYNISTNYGRIAVTCQDTNHNWTAPADFRVKELVGMSEAPLMHGISPANSFQAQCAGLPAPRRNIPHDIEIPDNSRMPKILMVANVYDPATNLAGGANLHQQIGHDKSVLVVRNAAGHTAYFQTDAFDGPSIAVMNKYLLTLELPEEGTVYDL